MTNEHREGGGNVLISFFLGSGMGNNAKSVVVIAIALLVLYWSP